MAESGRYESTDLYELLEVSPRASQRVIQAAYRALVQNSHPDVNPSSEAGPRIRQLNAAYRVLGNAEMRAHYDLACTRARRNRRALSADPTIPVRSVAGGPGRMLLPARAAAPVSRSPDRRPILSGATVLVLMTVVTLTALFLVLIWATLDTGHEDTLSFERPVVEISGR